MEENLELVNVSEKFWSNPAYVVEEVRGNFWEILEKF